MDSKVDTPFEDLLSDLESIIPERMQEAKVPGLSIALIEDAELIWSQGFGIKSAASGEPVTNDTIFAAQSLGKPVFAYAALKMCDMDFLELDTPLTEYLPEPYLPDELHQLITMRHVLCHTTGFPNWRPKGKPLKVLFAPGERFSYSGEGYVYLQKVIENMTGQPLDEFMKLNLLEPLGMQNSSFIWKEAFEMEAEAHGREGKPIGRQHWIEANGAGSLYSTPTDYARFVIEIIKPSKDDSYHLSKAMMEEMLNPQISIYFTISWGLGWGIQHSDDGDSFWQWGRGYKEGGYQHFAVAFKDQRTGVVIMTNSSNGLKICEDIVVNAIGREYPAFSDFLNI
jgi:CubicO group peptidase (beta-lactamase class C family)